MDEKFVMVKSSRSSKGYRPRGKLSKSVPGLGRSSLTIVGERRRVFHAVGKPLSWTVPVPRPTQEYHFATTYLVLAYLTSSNSAETDVGTNFTIGAMNSGELSGFVAVFDQFRIRTIEVLLQPRILTPNQNSTSNIGILTSAVDYDSSAAITLANLLTFTNTLTSSGLDSHYHAWSPTVQAAVGASGGSTDSDIMTVTSPWLDLATTNTPHYGLKVSISQTDSAYVYDLMVRLHLSFRMKI
jgi:hypothetical protein